MKLLSFYERSLFTIIISCFSLVIAIHSFFALNYYFHRQYTKINIVASQIILKPFSFHYKSYLALLNDLKHLSSSLYFPILMNAAKTIAIYFPIEDFNLFPRRSRIHT
jgi:hypothetical protein